MGNMSYCRFENTLIDLQDCADHMGNDEGIGGNLISCEGLPVSLYDYEFEVI